MEKRVMLEKRGKKPEEIKKLVLDCCRSTTIVGITDKFSKLESLSLVNVGLRNLIGLPKLPKLKKLDLSDNKISSGLDILKENCPELINLHLCANKIDTIEVLEPLKNLSNLTSLDLTTCEVTSLENYRDEVFKYLPHLKYLDGVDENNKAEPLDDDEVDEESEEDEKEVDLAYLQKPHIDEESEGDEEDVEDIVEDDEDDSEETMDDESNMPFIRKIWKILHSLAPKEVFSVKSIYNKIGNLFSVPRDDFNEHFISLILKKLLEKQLISLNDEGFCKTTYFNEWNKSIMLKGYGLSLEFKSEHKTTTETSSRGTEHLDCTEKTLDSDQCSSSQEKEIKHLRWDEETELLQYNEFLMDEKEQLMSQRKKIDKRMQKIEEIENIIQAHLHFLGCQKESTEKLVMGESEDSP